MANARVISSGVPTTPGPNGSIPVRRELRDLQTNYKDQFNLYILALADLQNKSPNELLSYYQLAGIHGEPFVPWNGVNGNPKASFGGYCTHSSILFLPWHRPYLATFEQALYASVQKIANTFPSNLRAGYVAAAKNFRMPYWDWALRITGDGRNQISAFPTALSSSSLTVVDVDGVSKPISNPLYSFRFDDKKIPQGLEVDSYWRQYGNTKRTPNPPGPKGSSQNGEVGRVITNEAASLRNNVSIVLLSYKQFDAISNNAWYPGSNRRYASIEDMHNEIHDKVGGRGGHMGALEVSAFDPVFWLHHTNVDRLWAIWQALNPNAYVIDKTVAKQDEENYTIAAGERVTEKTDLKPFYDASGSKFWNSTASKWTTPFGYAYPETQQWLYSSDQAYQNAVRDQVVKQYGANTINNFFSNIAPSSVSESAGTVDSEKPAVFAQTAAAEPEKKHTFDSVKKVLQHPIQAAHEVLHKNHEHAPQSKIASNESAKPAENGASNPETVKLADNNPTTVAASASTQNADVPVHAHPNSEGTVALNVPKPFQHLVPNRTYTEWITNLRAVKHGLSQTFRVYVFLGDFNPDPVTWPTEYNVVGRFTVLGRGGDTQCEKCHQDQDTNLVVTGTVPLTSALLQDIVEGQLASLNPEDVGPYLEKHLHWRVTLFDGSEQPRDQVPGLKVSIVSTSVRIGDDGLPVYSGQYEDHPNITDGRPAGLGATDDV
ncbi:tyrosinase precursor [Dendryphion nanum]|uniref:tyrosinase n=1 Tax=Dendryphion nanum TaxID=256645 RepID=A0A9P9E097_9PLEO|nr:tyrosinase precursor [Dendryphion nanum]